MKNINEIIAMTIAANEKKRDKIAAKTKKFLENTVAPALEEAASEGSTDIVLQVDADLDIDYIMEHLTNLGFDPKRKGRIIRVSWLFEYIKKCSEKA